MMTKCVSPWYNCTGCLGIKHQFTYLLVLLACSVKGYCAMLIGQASSCRYLHDSFLHAYWTGLLLPLPAWHSFLHAYWTGLLLPLPAWHSFLHAYWTGLLLPLPAWHSFLHAYWTGLLLPLPAWHSFLHAYWTGLLLPFPAWHSFLHAYWTGLLLPLPAWHSFLHAYWTGLLRQLPAWHSFLHAYWTGLLLQLPAWHSFLFKEGTVIMGGWKACYDINQGDKGTDIPSQLWCLFTSPKSWLAQVFLPRCIGVLCRGGNSQYALTPFVRHDTDWHTCSGEHWGRWCLGWSWFSPCGPERPCGPARELTMMVCV